MVISLILVLVGIALVIVNSNGFLIVDTWIIYLTFGLAGGIFILKLIFSFVAGRQAKKQFDRMSNRFDKFRF